MSALSEDLGVYVHIPFCERVCPYCDFAVEAVGSVSPVLGSAYVEDLLRELDLVLAHPLGRPLVGRRLATVYLGGGTPSLVDPEAVTRLLGHLASAFAGPPDEVTIELNPGLVETGRASELRSAGVTRASVGVQSFSDDVLRRLGRAQSGPEAARGLERVLAAKFASVSADLMFGVPNQTERGLCEDVDRLVDLGVDHVSAYALTIEPETPFGRADRRGELRLPDERTALRLARRARAQLAAAGYRQYEISSFARRRGGCDHRAQHNQRYWLRRDVLGLGVSAASLIQETRFQNPRVRGAWQDAVRAGQVAWSGSQEALSATEARSEAVALGLRRLDGVSRSAFATRYGAPPERCFPAEIAELVAFELVEIRGDRLRLSDRGVRFADEVFLRFVGR